MSKTREIELAVSEIVDSQRGLKYLLSLNLPGQMVVDLIKFIKKKIEPQVEIYSIAEKKLLKQYGSEIIENNRPTNNFEFETKDKGDKFDSEIKPIRANKITIIAPVFDYQKVIELNPKMKNSGDLLLIDFLFDFEDKEAAEQK